MNTPNTPPILGTEPSELAAQVIWSHWQSGQVLSTLPEACRPLSAEQGYAAQAQLPAVSGRTVVGWKIAATSTNGQKHINVSGPLAGRLLSGQVFDSGATVPSQGNRMRVAEPEFAFAMGQDLPPQSEPYTQQQVMAAVAALPGAQPLHDATRAAHAAGFWSGKLLAAREDVGRHNALDKLAGHLIRTPHPAGAVVLTSRVSIDMVQKVAALGVPILIAVSAPTAHAVALADQAGITLIALARPDRFEAYTHTDRISKETAHVA